MPEQKSPKEKAVKKSNDDFDFLKSALDDESEAKYPLDISSYDNFILSIENTDISWEAIIAMPEYGNGIWKVFCYSDFKKSVQKYDKKLRDDAFEAINNIVQDPTGKYCSKIFPLGRRLKNNWKYKLRDGFRMVYNFNTNAQEILIKAIGAKTDKFYENI